MRKGLDGVRWLRERLWDEERRGPRTGPSRPSLFKGLMERNEPQKEIRANRKVEGRVSECDSEDRFREVGMMNLSVLLKVR